MIFDRPIDRREANSSASRALSPRSKSFKLRPFFFARRRRMAPRQVVSGGDAEGLLPSLSKPSAFANAAGESTVIGISGLTPSTSPSREHSTPLTPRRASAMLRGAASAAAAPTRQAITSVLSSWVSRRFLGGLAVLVRRLLNVFISGKKNSFLSNRSLSCCSFKGSFASHASFKPLY